MGTDANIAKKVARQVTETGGDGSDGCSGRCGDVRWQRWQQNLMPVAAEGIKYACRNRPCFRGGAVQYFWEQPRSLTGAG